MAVVRYVALRVYLCCLILASVFQLLTLKISDIWSSFPFVAIVFVQYLDCGDLFCSFRSLLCTPFLEVWYIFIIFGICVKPRRAVFLTFLAANSISDRLLFLQYSSFFGCGIFVSNIEKIMLQIMQFPSALSVSSFRCCSFAPV